MRKLHVRGALLVSTLLVLTVFPSGFAQQAPPALQPLLQQMLTGNLAEREQAFWAIKAIPHAAAQPQVQKVFLQVLQREDEFINFGPTSDDPAYGESYMEYVGWIGEFVWRYAKLTNSEDRATLFAIAESPGALPSVEGDWLATRTAINVDDLLALAKNPRLRSDALHGLAKFLNAARSGRRQMVPARAKAAKARIIAALASPSAGDRYAAAFVIGLLKDPDDAHYLAALSNDPDRFVRGLARGGAAWLAKQPPVHHIAH